jgi:hypothetical protein
LAGPQLAAGPAYKRPLERPNAETLSVPCPPQGFDVEANPPPIPHIHFGRRYIGVAEPSEPKTLCGGQRTGAAEDPVFGGDMREVRADLEGKYMLDARKGGS